LISELDYSMNEFVLIVTAGVVAPQQCCVGADSSSVAAPTRCLPGEIKDNKGRLNRTQKAAAAILAEPITTISTGGACLGPEPYHMNVMSQPSMF
jgi:hypothetical protein